MLSGDLSISVDTVIILAFVHIFIPVLLILTRWPDFDDHTCQLLYLKKSLAYFLIVNLTGPQCIETKSSLLISMSLTNKEYLYSKKTRLRSKVSLSEFYGPWAWLYLWMSNFLFVFCRRYARWMGRWMSDSLERTTGGWVLFIEHYVCTVIETYMHMVIK